ncbi:MAG: glutamine-hydrolyzing carbamoyl-phosphate synthase small subunit [Gammaproteobacteria bacterium]|nr:glutamine-hydrolyzing carbamoyl-phosphate synthase small subunit [Gammaproteobacteria bacterium]
MNNTALLALQDGSLFWGQSIGASGSNVGEVVFNTSMTGYQEILTDPSYARQMVTLTYPHIGNTGTNPEDTESDQVFATGLIIRDLPRMANNWRNTENLDDYLQRHNVVAIADIDTRQLTRLLREKGAQNGCLMAGDNIDSDAAIAQAQNFPGLKGMDLAKEVTTSESYEWQQSVWTLKSGFAEGQGGQYKVVAYDFGVKHNILRILRSLGCDVHVVPATTSAEEVLAMQPDGVFLSNGPGDPEPCDYAIAATCTFIEQKIPIFGICLGHQILALASGASTEKMKFGHHGANHPVQDLASNQVMITSQNHGFAVREENLPDTLQVTHRSLFDDTIQGIERTDAPAFSFQGHPEASPGPHDVAPLFERFISMMQEHS